MSPLKLLSQDKIGDFLNLLPISRENLRTIDFCLGSFARYTCMVDIGSPPPRAVPDVKALRT